MNKIQSLTGTFVLAAGLVLAGCQSNLTGPTGDQGAAPDASMTSANSAVSVGSGSVVTAGKSDKAAKPGPMIWANGELFKSIVTSATFSGDEGPFDALYVLSSPHTFAGSYDHLSDSAPGDQDYNGGRWEVFHLKPGVDASKYDDVNSIDDPNFSHSDWISVEVYFECPILPNRGSN